MGGVLAVDEDVHVTEELAVLVEELGLVPLLDLGVRVGELGQERNRVQAAGFGLGLELYNRATSTLFC